MELRTLRAFVEVVRQGGFTEAAKVVFATQSTVSKAVKQLEDELDLKLLDRIGSRSVITAAGEIVYQRALKMLAERQDLIAELDELRGLRRGVLRLGLPRVSSDILFAPLFVAYRARYPGVEVRMVQQGEERREDLLHAGEVDLAGLLLPVPDEFEYKEFRREPIVALVAKSSPLADRKTLRFSELASTPVILFELGGALNPIIVDACQQNGFTPNVVAHSSQIGFILELAAGGMGVAFLPRAIFDHRPHEGLAALPVTDPDLEWRMTHAWRRGAYLSTSARAWLDLAEEIGPTLLHRP
jgi:DNA-binding transcriptional LysR family regulator